MNFATKPDDIGNLDAVVLCVLPVNMKHISNGHYHAIDLISSSVILLSTNINLLVRTPEIVDNKVIDWNYVVNVNSSVHNHMDNTSDHGNETDDDDDDYDFVDYFQDDPNPVIHTPDYDAARELNHHDDLHTEEDMDILESLF
jgi:hypothetical protein